MANGMTAYDEHAPLPKLPVPEPTLSKEKLLLSTPTVIVDTKKDANATELQQFCYRNQFAVIKSLTSAIKLDLGLFSTKTLVETAPDFQVEVRTQLYYPNEPGIITKKESSWAVENARSITSVAKYAHYQLQSFQQSLKEEHERSKANSRNGSLAGDCDPFGKKSFADGQPKVIKFGINVDLSDDVRWNSQLQVSIDMIR
ncbi:unnamed protein product [Soboliphyme baturini]|uniref:DUF4140 domain-containing protein n=1 Tax=Soboliphyme baturini TaxID=241478 RepID=A0A183IAH8_9BILA|nr:unnamed protein product [Soboliphyme baturini]